MKKLPTLEQCYEIVANQTDSTYYATEHSVRGYKVVTFNYRFIPNFNEPFVGSDVSGHELRGISFVFNTDGTLFERFPLLDKNFNINQVAETQYDLLKDLEINEITFKEDGSVISFVKLPNGDFVAKTKNSFESSQSGIAQEIYEKDKNLRNLISELYDKRLVPIFEYTSPNNHVVLQYNKESLILLKVRNMDTGEYINVDNFRNKDVKVVDKFNFTGTLEELMTLTKGTENIEGYIVEFKNGMMVKLKTEWYCARHNLYTGLLVQLNSIACLIIDDEIDDIMCDPSVDIFKKDKITKIANCLSKYESRVLDYVRTKSTELDGLNLNNYKLYLESRKYDYSDMILQYVRRNMDDEWLSKSVRVDMRANCYYLGRCRDFLSNLGYVEEIEIIE